MEPQWPVLQGADVGWQALGSTADLQDWSVQISLQQPEANGRVRVLATSYRDVIEEYFMTHQHLKREIEGRLIIED